MDDESTKNTQASSDRLADEYVRRILLAFHLGDKVLHFDELWRQTVSVDFHFFRTDDVAESPKSRLASTRTRLRSADRLGTARRRWLAHP